ncbi:hypothetical protein [Microbacterium sp. H1-D42]|uniref:hypothetical protein n=1 Tax=Microbacterium sp. H1-D42 TaxID=2925844 RepID=UPI001F53102D|nr:hypothetical protein [Microbacterium sp. H1-D42]UNK70125.1 hypothetical protein MNR00_13270 [Microbacterium sp. H1-D42]
MTNRAAIKHEDKTSGISRRTVVKGVAWTVPAIAVAGTVPTAAASELPCINNIAPTGGTYPVSLSLSGCNTANSHWDFTFKITAALQDCECERIRVTMFDNPKRSRLWISNDNDLGSSNSGHRNPSTNTSNGPGLYIQKELGLGQSANFPAAGDTVRRVDTNGQIGTIGAYGTADDSMHVLIDPSGGGAPCGATGPMATYKVECRKGGAWEDLGTSSINPCVPMIKVVSACSLGGGRYRLGITVLNNCRTDASDFKITNIQRNNDSNYPTEGRSVWGGSQALSSGTTFIETASNNSSGNSLWVSFSSDGVNTSTVRVNTGSGC